MTTPIGILQVTATALGLSRIDLMESSGGTATSTRRRNTGSVPVADHARGQHHVRAAELALRAYFDGARDAFRDLALDPEGTPFQRSVWQALRTIPYGETISYRDLAGRIGKPAAMRAVGLANGRNPLPIIVPCHRVIGADGTLTGFGLGVSVKAWLLVHEGAADPLPARVTAATRLTRRSSGSPFPV